MSKRKLPVPRKGFYFLREIINVNGSNNTWLEGEDFCYPSGAMKRRCYAINEVTKKHLVIRCGIPDTFFSIPCVGGGYISIEDNPESENYKAFIYHPPLN